VSRGKIKYVIVDDWDIDRITSVILRKGLCSYVRYGGNTIVARYGVNKTTLRKLIKEELDDTSK